MADLTIVVDVRDNQTMSVYRVPKSGKIIFVNASQTDQLVVTPKDSELDIPENQPFCKNDKKTPINPLIVGKSGSGEVRICDLYTGKEVLYTAAIGEANPEDPIVIIEAYAYGPIFSLLRDPIVIIEAVLVVVALAAGYALGRRHAARKTQPSAGRP